MPTKYPSLAQFNAKLVFPKFPDYKIVEVSDFDSSNEESDDNEKDERNDLSSQRCQYQILPKEGVSRLDRIRGLDGTIDLGLQRSDFAKDEIPDMKTRKLISYDDEGKVELKRGEPNTKVLTPSGGSVGINFEFGDRGSSWRMMKLSKLGKNPSESKIFEQYATLWDYQLACEEREELESRKIKKRSEWLYGPSQKLLASREEHVKMNMEVVKGFKSKGDDRGRNTSDRVIKMKRYGDVKTSKSKKLKNELKLAHLTSLDYDDDNGFALSREQIESLTTSP